PSRDWFIPKTSFATHLLQVRLERPRQSGRSLRAASSMDHLRPPRAGRPGSLPPGRRLSAGRDEALQLAQGLQPQFHGTEALRLLKLGSGAEHHAERDLRRPVLILERGPRVGMLRPVLAPQERVADPLLGPDL